MPEIVVDPKAIDANKMVPQPPQPPGVGNMGMVPASPMVEPEEEAVVIAVDQTFTMKKIKQIARLVAAEQSMKFNANLVTGKEGFPVVKAIFSDGMDMVTADVQIQGSIAFVNGIQVENAKDLKRELVLSILGRQGE